MLEYDAVTTLDTYECRLVWKTYQFGFECAWLTKMLSLSSCLESRSFGLAYLLKKAPARRWRLVMCDRGHSASEMKRSKCFKHFSWIDRVRRQAIIRRVIRYAPRRESASLYGTSKKNFPRARLPMMAVPMMALPVMALPMTVLPMMALPMTVLPVMAQPMMVLPMMDGSAHTMALPMMALRILVQKLRKLSMRK